MSKIRTSKGQNVESIFRMNKKKKKDQNFRYQNVESFLAKNTFNVLILPMAEEKIRTSKVF